MNSLSDQLLNGGCVTLLENVHGETITVLTGADAGKKFTAIKENEQDISLESPIDRDPRAARYLRFRNVPGNVPNLSKLDKIRTADGLVWTATLENFGAYLTVDFKIIQIN